MTQAANLGFPRIGAKRELKQATEAYWKGALDAAALIATAKVLRARHWKTQKDAGIAVIPCNDFSFYDQMLDLTATVGAVPPRFRNGMSPTHPNGSARGVMEGATGGVGGAGDAELDRYFAMARGTKEAPAMEMTKWFDTNYHYIVPEFHKGQTFSLSSRKAVEEFKEAKALGMHTRPVLIGPVTYLSLGKVKGEDFDALSLLDSILPVYAQLLDELKSAGADWVQIDEPILSLDLSQAQKRALRLAYKQLVPAAPKIMLANYFGPYGDNLAVAADLPVAGHHLDLVRGRSEFDRLLTGLPTDRVLSLGVVDGRNIWRANLPSAFERVERALAVRGKDLIQIAPSCSLIHAPVDLDGESKLDAELKGWLAFAKQKLAEVAALAVAATKGKDVVAASFAASEASVKSRRASKRIHDAGVGKRMAAVSEADLSRKSPFVTRRAKQKATIKLPAFPTTTIGSFPQTAEVRKARAANRKGELDDAAYESFLKKETEKAVRIQEDLGIDVLVHGEFERNDMVEYFGEQLSGFAFTQNGWVQSYGSRYVKPPIIFGDVSRPKAMTVQWSAYAQSLTNKPLKGMLTGPVTILQWSFVRDDQPRSATCKQIALAIRDEVIDLEKAGIRLIQIDEPALREGLPLRVADRGDFLRWAVDCFRLSAAGVADDTQIHTHMCYCEFNDIMPSIAELDADVISIETSRSDMELLESFSDFKYPNEIGPGVYDIHSPRCPSTEDMVKLLAKARERLAPDQIWVNPDCGLKTRRWEEVKPALQNMVAAARASRSG